MLTDIRIKSEILHFIRWIGMFKTTRMPPKCPEWSNRPIQKVQNIPGTWFQFSAWGAVNNCREMWWDIKMVTENADNKHLKHFLPQTLCLKIRGLGQFDPFRLISASVYLIIRDLLFDAILSIYWCPSPPAKTHHQHAEVHRWWFQLMQYTVHPMHLV